MYNHRYPSLLESSDIDGGSSVAVLTYLRRILESINHPDLIHLILQYLFAISDQPIHKQMSLPGDRMSASRRKSLNLLTHFADGEDKPSPTLFNLGDLILTSLRSKSQQTVAATLKLVSVMIQRHHQYVISTLLRTSPAVQSRPQRTIGAHNKEMELLFSLIDDLGEDDNLDKSYDNHIKDNLSLLECHPCSAQLLANQDTSSPTNTSSATSIPRNSPNDLDLRNLRPDDSLLRAILTLLRTFLTNSAETNLNLTEVVAGLASCGYVLIEGWLVVDPSNDLLTNGVKFLPVHDEDLHCDLDLLIGEQHNEIDDNDRDQMRALQMAHRQPFWTAEDTSPVFAVLQSLVDQIHIYRTEIPNFDTYLSERKQAFQVDEKLTEALASIPPIRSSQDCSRFSTSSTLSPDIGPLGSIAQRMFPEQASASISRPSSPRGRQRVLSEAPTPFGKLRQLSLKGSPSPSQASRRAISPSPLRKDFLSPTPPQPSSVRTADVDVLKRKVSITSKSPIAKVLAEGRGSSETSSLFSESTAPNDEKEMAPVEVSVSHLLTNVLILQEFVLELAAIIQVRASLFGEVKFT